VPLYEFVCSRCEHAFEELVFGKETVECPQCHATEVKRQMSMPARPQSTGADVPMACNSEGPPCGAPWCRRGPA
jgi:putative FmdB family regulatory protein